MKRRTLLIINPGAASGRGSDRCAELLARLQQLGIHTDHVLTERAGQAIDVAFEASSKYDLIAAVGGDGTVNEVACGLLLAGDARAALAVLPVGTGNDVAQLVGVPNPETACRALTEGPIRTMDAVEVSCADHGKPVRRFGLLYAAVGFAGEVGKCTTPLIKRIFGARYCYSVGFFRALFQFESPHMRVRCDDREFEGEMFLVSAGNAEIVGGGAMRLSPGAKIDDGKLNVNVVRNLSRLEITRCFPKLLMGTHVTHPRVEYFTATRVSVESQPAMDVQIDGELFGQTPVTFQVKPNAIRVCTGWGISEES